MEETANEYCSQAASEGSFRIGAKLNDHRFATKRLWVPVLFCSGLILHFKTYCDCVNPPNNGRAQCTNSKLQQLLLDICNEHLPVWPTQTGSYVALYFTACMFTLLLGQFIGGCLPVLSSIISAFYIEANVHLVWTIHISFYDWGRKRRFLLKCTAL